MQLCVSDMQQQKQLNLNARVCVPAGSSCLFSCPNVAGVSPCRPSYNNTRRAGTISGTICRYDLCVQQWAGRYGTRHGAAMSHTHPPTTYPYLLQLQVVSLLYMQRVSKRVSVSGKKDCLSCQIFFSEQLEVEKQQTASMAQFCIKTYCCQMNFSVVTISEFWHLE